MFRFFFFLPFFNALVPKSFYIQYILLEARPKNVTVVLGFFSFKASGVSGHLLYELMAFLILRCSQPSHQPLKTLAVAFVNHSLLTNFVSQVFFFPLFFFFNFLT